MGRLRLAFLFVFICHVLVAQDDSGLTGGEEDGQDVLEGDSEEEPKAKIQDYLIISHQQDTTYVDTTLSIKKEYKFNYLRKDNFGLMPFSNLGQTYNSLTYNFKNTSLMPGFGARAKHFNYWEVEDINYYKVPTPLTELFFKTALEQGQLTDAFFTANMSSQFNFSIAYKGMRSLGKYQHILASSGNFRFTSNYQTKNKRYSVRGHIVTQDLLNQENGGLQDNQVSNFQEGEEEFIDRSILEVNFEDAENLLKGKRFHLEHGYVIVKKRDSLSKNKLSLNHTISFEDKYYQYDQLKEDSIFGKAFVSKIKDRSTLENFYNDLRLKFNNKLLGDFEFNVSNNNYNYGYDKIIRLQEDNVTITNRLKGDVLSVGGKYHKCYKGFRFQGELGHNIEGDFKGDFLAAKGMFQLDKNFSLGASINYSSKAPNYNTLLYQSGYKDYNWQNSFNNIETQQLKFNLKWKELAKITADFNTIKDYVYFKKDEISEQIKPFQNDKETTYLRVKFENEIKVARLALNNTVLYQNIEDDNMVLNVPRIITRNTLYYSNQLFKKAMQFQTGVTFNYFTKYYMNAYNPLLAEFYVQTEESFGGFPRLDFFINARIRQTRIFLKAEHFNASFTGYDYFSAPNNPYRDFIVRFGVVWNFFL